MRRWHCRDCSSADEPRSSDARCTRQSGMGPIGANLDSVLAGHPRSDGAVIQAWPQLALIQQRAKDVEGKILHADQALNEFLQTAVKDTLTCEFKLLQLSRECQGVQSLAVSRTEAVDVSHAARTRQNGIQGCRLRGHCRGARILSCRSWTHFQHV